jgi:hypothetical protein
MMKSVQFWIALKIATIGFLNKLAIGMREESQVTPRFGAWTIGRMETPSSEMEN